MTTILPYLTGIYIYPIKSLDRVSLSQVKMLKSGALERDRRWALFDEKGHFVNAKNHAKIHNIRSWFDLQTGKLTLKIQGNDEQVTFDIDQEKAGLEVVRLCREDTGERAPTNYKLEKWFSDYFNFAVQIAENPLLGFPDDLDSPGPTVISTATLETISGWFPGLNIEDLRLRFRPNLEIGGVPPFWEDQLFTEADKIVKFKIGNILFEGVNPCQRCIVPTRDANTSEIYPNFTKIFVKKRQELLPPWTTRSRFNHFYRVSVNTRVPESEAGKILQIGDEVKIIDNG
jgi:uncharacterized protein